MTELQKQIVTAVLRWALHAGGMYLVAHHVISADQSERATESGTVYLVEHAALWGPSILALGWSILNKVRTHG